MCNGARYRQKNNRGPREQSGEETLNPPYIGGLFFMSNGVDGYHGPRLWSVASDFPQRDA